MTLDELQTNSNNDLQQSYEQLKTHPILINCFIWFENKKRKEKNTLFWTPERLTKTAVLRNEVLDFQGQIRFHSHCVKSIQVRSFFWSVFSRIRTEYGEILVSLCIQSECGEIRTRKNSYLDTFHAVSSYLHFHILNILNMSCSVRPEYR